MKALTPPTIDEVATVLEAAADLYESEKVNWCAGQWIEQANSFQLSACAEGALLLAAGHGVQTVAQEVNALFITDPVAGMALSELENHINEGRDSRVSLHGWNDSKIGNRRVVWIDGVEDLTEPIIPVAKAQVIEAMKQTAKDLRNREGNDDK